MHPQVHAMEQVRAEIERLCEAGEAKLLTWSKEAKFDDEDNLTDFEYILVFRSPDLAASDED